MNEKTLGAPCKLCLGGRQLHDFLRLLNLPPGAPSKLCLGGKQPGAHYPRWRAVESCPDNFLQQHEQFLLLEDDLVAFFQAFDDFGL